MPQLMLQGQEAGKTIHFLPLTTLTSEDVMTSLLNILLFVPFGFGLPFITDFRMKKVVFIGLLCSFLIELLQLTTGLISGISFRIADVNDILFNTTGVVIGYLLFVVFIRVYRQIYHTWKTTNPILRYIAERTQEDTYPLKYGRKLLSIVVIVGSILAVSALYSLYQNHQQPVRSLQDGNRDQSGRIDNESSNFPQSGDLCGGTGGTGEITQVGGHSITIKRNDGVIQTFKLISQTTIRTSMGPASEGDLKRGDRVTLVVEDTETASTVLVCTVPSSGSQPSRK